MSNEIYTFASVKRTIKNNNMRKVFVECKTRYQAQKECPWANNIAKVGEGFMCFETITDYEIWKNQK